MTRAPRPHAAISDGTRTLCGIDPRRSLGTVIAGPGETVRCGNCRRLLALQPALQAQGPGAGRCPECRYTLVKCRERGGCTQLIAVPRVLDPGRECHCGALPGQPCRGANGKACPDHAARVRAPQQGGTR